MPIIDVKNVSLQLNGNIILDDVSICIKSGEYVGLIGPNGAGKTSLIKTILGLYKPTKGSITIAPKTRIGYVPQGVFTSNIVPISVQEILTMSGIKNKAELKQSLKKVQLSASLLTKNFHTLSGGQKQRVIIARSLCKNPNLLIFDEPLTGVDYATKIKLYKLLALLNKSEKITILFVSHEVDQIIAECHRILCLNKTMHTGCHPIDFAKGHTHKCTIPETPLKTLPIHHHHHKQQK